MGSTPVRAALAVLFCLAALLPGCGHGHEACGMHDHDPACFVCTGSEHPLTPGATLTADNGFELELVRATPTPLVSGDNEVVVKVRKDGALADGVDFTGTQSWYPTGGHGSPLLPTVTATGNPGEYTLAPVNFLHAGAWEIRFTLAAAAGTATYALPVCIEDAPGT